MRNLVVATLAVATLSTGAYAVAPSTPDQACSHHAVPDTTPAANPDMWVGPLQGGPIAQNGTLRCTIKINISTHATTTPYDITRATTGASGATSLPPELVTYAKEPGDFAYLCTEFFDGSTTWYYDALAAFPSWSMSPGVPCQPV